MAFKSIHTTVGLQLMAQAEAQGTQINLTQMAVGDGNGNPTEPVESQTQLVRERFRANVNRVYQDPNKPTMFTAELIIPASTGGFTLREVGLFDSNGNLFVVGNLPDTYKPTGTDGAFADTVIRVSFMVSNAAIVELHIDPNVVIATQSWIINNINPATLFPGGTTNQILRKKSNADGDTEWADPSIATIVVDVIEEEQTLAASQTSVDWVDVTNTGLAVYIEGVRIPRKVGVDGWQPDAINATTRITLGKAYPAGTKIMGIQNEPLGDVPFPLEQSKNLSDVPNKAVARGNLDVWNKTETRANGMQPGAVVHFARTTAPAGYLKANGAAVSRTTYADLFAAIGTVFGTGDGFNTFNLPDLRGEFLRGWADGRNVDSGRVFGSAQGDAIRNITGSIIMDNEPVQTATGAFFDDGVASGRGSNNDSSARKLGFDASRQVPTATENRPRNIAMLACIKF